MKKLYLIILLALCSVSAQNVFGQSYSINKQTYDHRLYIPEYGDVYDPMLMGAYSAIMPGAGQIIMGETGRGISFMVPGILAYATTIYGGYRWQKESSRDFWRRAGTESPDKFSTLTDDKNIGPALTIAGVLGIVAINTWAFIDAMKVAKVTNMYLRDVRDGYATVSLRIDPFVETNTYLGKLNTSMGVSLKVTF